jgi:glycosyltransferase involved in cell wall biosynthesis
MKLTIITPSLNQAAYLERTLESVLDQGYEPLEYLVVDGGSTDGSVDILRRYDERLTWWVSEPDSGQTDALNKALKRATGDVIAYINSDDYYLPGAFAAATGALRANPAARWVVGRCVFIDADSGERVVWTPEQPKRMRSTWVLAPWGVPQAATFWRREVFDELGLFREDMHYTFDTEFGLRLALNGHMPLTIDAELAVRFEHEDAKSADRTRWTAEEARFPELFAGLLTPAERAAMKVSQIADRAGWFRLMERIHPHTSRIRRRLAA